MEKCDKVAGLFVATLKAISLIHQQAHWLTNGPNFYGNHKLFEEIYKSTLEDLDTAAEEVVGVFGEDSLNYEYQTELLNKLLLKYKNLSLTDGQASVAVEQDFIKFCREAYNCFETEGRLSLGLDDVIMSIAANHEKNLYLLNQAQK
jgi:DNA-binding ferritin-like protein